MGGPEFERDLAAKARSSHPSSTARAGKAASLKLAKPCIIIYTEMLAQLTETKSKCHLQLTFGQRNAPVAHPNARMLGANVKWFGSRLRTTRLQTHFWRVFSLFVTPIPSQSQQLKLTSACQLLLPEARPAARTAPRVSSGQEPAASFLLSVIG